MMQRYDLRIVLSWVADCQLIDAIPTLMVARFRALVDQANSAWEAERRAERAEQQLGRYIAEGVNCAEGGEG